MKKNICFSSGKRDSGYDISSGKIRSLFKEEKFPYGGKMNKLTETQHYIIYKEYESVILEIKKNHRMVQIGDFYGDARMAAISEDESFCAMCGCGVIIYYLQEPFKEYEYHTQTEQWKEWGRNKIHPSQSPL